MIGKDEGLRKVCAHYEQVENYSQAVADKEQLWHLHHRNEIDEMKSKQQLIDEGKYYDVEPADLIFLTHSEHMRLHNAGEKNPLFGKYHTEATKKKMSENHADVKGEKNPLFGKHHSEAARKKMSEAQKGEKHPQFGKVGENSIQFGKHWWNNGIECTRCENCPGEGFVRGRL